MDRINPDFEPEEEADVGEGGEDAKGGAATAQKASGDAAVASSAGEASGGASSGGSSGASSGESPPKRARLAL